MKISLTTEQTTEAIEQYVMAMLANEEAWKVKHIKVEAYSGADIELVPKEKEVADDRETV